MSLSFLKSPFRAWTQQCKNFFLSEEVILASTNMVYGAGEAGWAAGHNFLAISVQKIAINNSIESSSLSSRVN